MILSEDFFKYDKELEKHTEGFINCWTFLRHMDEKDYGDGPLLETELELHQHADWLEKNAPSTIRSLYRSIANV